jgi:cobalt-precorrin 5A hydrolase/precorrin-3B C17-methyltransferase
MGSSRREQDVYPIALVRTQDLAAVVVGGGPVGARKVHGLLAAGIRVRLISPEAVQDLQALAEQGSITWEQRRYETGDLEGARLVFAAASHRLVNRRVASEARHAGILCNVADAPDDGSFIVPAVYRSGRTVVAVSTGGASPSRAAAIRDRLASVIEEDHR